jgi:hypothetical protein
MKLSSLKQRGYASLIILGSGFLLYRTVMMMAQGYLTIFVWWVATLLILEFLVDVACLVSALYWWGTKDGKKSRLPLRLTAAVIVVHAIRVLVFVLGRTEPFNNFDIRPEYWPMHHTRWSWEGVYFAGIMSALSLVILLVLWQYKRGRKIR